MLDDAGRLPRPGLVAGVGADETDILYDYWPRSAFTPKPRTAANYKMEYKMFFCSSLALFVLAIPSLAADADDFIESPRITRDVNDKEITDAARFAMDELKELSDSGIYKTLVLERILSAETQEGVFHANTFLHLELSSPHLKGGKFFTRHEVMVMKSLDDGVYSFAIDEFPVPVIC